MFKVENDNGNGVRVTLRIDAKTVVLLLSVTGSGWLFALFGDHLRPRYVPQDINHSLAATVLESLDTYTYRGEFYWRKDGSPSLAGLERHLSLPPGALNRKGLVRDVAWELYVARQGSAADE